MNGMHRFLCTRVVDVRPGHAESGVTGERWGPPRDVHDKTAEEGASLQTGTLTSLLSHRLDYALRGVHLLHAWQRLSLLSHGRSTSAKSSCTAYIDTGMALAPSPHTRLVAIRALPRRLCASLVRAFTRACACAGERAAALTN